MPYASPSATTVAQHVVQPGGREEEVDEARAGDLDACEVRHVGGLERRPRSAARCRAGCPPTVFASSSATFVAQSPCSRLAAGRARCRPAVRAARPRRERSANGVARSSRIMGSRADRSRRRDKTIARSVSREALCRTAMLFAAQGVNGLRAVRPRTFRWSSAAEPCGEPLRCAREGVSAAAAGYRSGTCGALSRCRDRALIERPTRRRRTRRWGCSERVERRLLATHCDQRLGHRAHLPGARRARRAVRTRRRGGRARRAPDSAARSSAPAAGRSAPTTKSCSSRRPGLYTQPALERRRASTARSCSRCACSRCGSTSCATTRGTTRSPVSTTAAASTACSRWRSRAATGTAGSSRS